jgi:rod shape-determining protein MreC
MNKKILFIFLTILVLLGYIFHIDKIIYNKIQNTTLDIKSFYNKYFEDTSKYLSSIYQQQKTINTLQGKLSTNQHFKNLYEIEHQELISLKQNFLDNNISTKLQYVEALSYLNLNDFSKVILDTNLTTNNKIFGLITLDNFSAGIVLTQNNKTIGYLNSNPKCNYAVFIGANKAPAITSGTTKTGDIIVQYIPKWYDVNINDKVITSGMDGIFPIGIKVGIVTNIKELSNTKTATIKPYTKVLSKKYFYIVKGKL